MSEPSEQIDLAFIGRALQRLTTEVAAMRDDLNVLAAILRRHDNMLDRMLDELRAMHAQYDRTAGRVRTLEEQSLHRP